MNWYKTSQELDKPSFPEILDRDQMIDFIVDSGLRDCNGELCYEDAKEISGYVDEWRLTKIPLDSFNWSADPGYRNKSKNFPPIVIFVDGEYEVLDGKHRIGMAKELGQKTMWVYLGSVQV
jgi:hypothetical protein